jgi:hypothetical protein
MNLLGEPAPTFDDPIGLLRAAMNASSGTA